MTLPVRVTRNMPTQYNQSSRLQLLRNGPNIGDYLGKIILTNVHLQNQRTTLLKAAHEFAQTLAFFQVLTIQTAAWEQHSLETQHLQTTLGSLELDILLTVLFFWLECVCMLSCVRLFVAP